MCNTEPQGQASVLIEPARRCYRLPAPKKWKSALDKALSLLVLAAVIMVFVSKQWGNERTSITPSCRRQCSRVDAHYGVRRPGLLYIAPLGAYRQGDEIFYFVVIVSETSTGFVSI